MITAYGGVESYIESMNQGAFEYLNKPVKGRRIEVDTKEVLQGSRAINMCCQGVCYATVR